MIGALIGLASAAVPLISNLFDDDESVAGQAVKTVAQVAEAVTGKRGDEAAEVLKQDPTLYAEFQKQLSAEAVRLYAAQTERLKAEQGAVDAGTLSSMSKEAADKVASMRMTTRPEIVRRMSHVIMLPVYVFGVDLLVSLVNVVSAAAGHPANIGLVGAQFFSADSVYLSMYQWASPTAATIVVAYMGLREAGKSAGLSDHPMGGVLGLLRKVGGGGPK